MNKQTRLFLIFAMLVAGLLIIVFSMDHTMRQKEANRITDDMVWETSIMIKNQLDAVYTNLNFLKQQPLAIQRLKENTPSEKGILEETYLKMINTNENYMQLRILDMQGNEVVRVDRSKTGTQIIPPEGLQNKANRYYFQDALKLKPHDIYQSRFDLNIEHNTIVAPWEPTIRFIAPVIDHDGHQDNIVGFVIINFNGNKLLSDIEQLDKTVATKISIINQDGYFIYTANTSHRWGFMFNNEALTLATMNPELWNVIKNPTSPDHFSLNTTYYSTKQVCSDLTCTNNKADVLLPVHAQDLPWVIIAESEQVGFTNLEWLSSPLSYLLALFILLMLGYVYRTLCYVSRQANFLLDKQKQLEKSNQRFSILLESLPEGFVMLNSQAKIETINQASLHIFGMTKEQLIGQPIEVIMSGAFKEMHYHKTASFFKNPRRVEITREHPFHYQHPQGFERILQVLIEPMIYEDQVYALILIKDVTLSIKQEEQIRQSQKMDALGQLTGGVAHDFNNLLAIMIGNLELLEMTTADNPTIQKKIEKISKAAQTASELTQKLLAISRRKTLSTEIISVVPFLNDLMDMLHRTIKERIEIKLDTPKTLPDITTDTSELTNALINLVINARDAMLDGGIIFIKAEHVILNQDDINAFSDPIFAGNYVLIEVSDTGSGIPKALLNKVLEPFFTTKEKGKGTGLGLAMVYGFMKQSKGHMRIYSEEGHGTSIHLYFPVVTLNTEHTNDTASLETTDDTLRLLNVLVVDDEQELADVAKEYLAIAGMNCDLAYSADQAWDMLQKNNYDIVFSDIVMPGEIDGIGLYHRVSDTMPHVSIILASGFSEEMIQKQHTLGKELVFIKKPYKRQQLIDAIKKVTQTKSIK